jgi:hypothetical protein
VRAWNLTMCVVSYHWGKSEFASAYSQSTTSWSVVRRVKLRGLLYRSWNMVKGTQLLAPAAFHHRERASYAHWIWTRIGYRAILDTVAVKSETPTCLPLTETSWLPTITVRRKPRSSKWECCLPGSILRPFIRELVGCHWSPGIKWMTDESDTISRTFQY